MSTDIEKRGRYLARATDLRDREADALAYSEAGYSEAGIAKRIDASQGTAKKYLDRVAAQYGIPATFPKSEDDRGELTEVTQERVFGWPSNMREMWLEAAARHIQHVPEELHEKVEEFDAEAAE